VEQKLTTPEQQVQRLLSLARRAGNLLESAVQQGQRERAYHFMYKMYGLMKAVHRLVK
jgi:hypothetical protein